MLPEPPFSGFYELVALMLAMIAWRIWGWRVRKALQDFLGDPIRVIVNEPDVRLLSNTHFTLLRF